jgi:hypothetical protein
LSARTASAQESNRTPEQEQQKDTIRALLDRIMELQEDVRNLKVDMAKLKAVQNGAMPQSAAIQTLPAAPPSPAEAVSNAARTPADSQSEITNPKREQAEETAQDASMEHTMELPHGGPALKIRGFFDVNLGLGADANPLIYPLGVPSHNTFQLGEFNLFMTSKLTDSISFLSETIIGSDATNGWGVDLERAELTYKMNDYFEVSAGRFHTAIGYYNTAFHHGTWFQTATGRPFMYFFEDSGGILPVHSVGVTATGLVPHTGSLRLHWIVETANGESSSFLSRPSEGSPVQNFLSGTNHKAFNLAAYLRPAWAPGLQIGASFYHDRFVPTGIPHVDQNISSVHVVYINSDWEIMNEAVLLRDKSDGSRRTFNTPLAYTQISRKFGDFRPYFRYQYVNVPHSDPLFPSIGRYQGPSAGLRMDFTPFAALKVQYNRLYTDGAQPKNGLDSQLAFTF